MLHGPTPYPTQGLLAVASREGMIKVLGGPGVELVVEDEGALAAIEEPPSHIMFPTPSLLVGITAMGGVLAWDLADGGRRCGHLPSPADENGLEDGVTAVHCPQIAVSPSVDSGGTAAQDQQHYVYMGRTSGGVGVVQVFPTCRLSGYVVDPREIASGVPEELRPPVDGGDGEGALGAVTALASSGNRDGGGLLLIGHRYGAIVLWDLVRRKRLAVHGLSAAVGSTSDHGAGSMGDGDWEVTSLAFHPSGEAFAAGFTCGCYAIFPTASSRSVAAPRWISEVGDDGSFPREGPTMVRTPVSLVKWARFGQGPARAWGLLVAGGVEMEEGAELDGVSLLVPLSIPLGSGGVPEQSSGGGGRSKKHTAAALATLETAVFVPFAIGQEKLSCVHAVVYGGNKYGEDGSAREHTGPDDCTEMLVPPVSIETAIDGEFVRNDTEVNEAERMEVTQLVVIGLVEWTEEVRGDDGHLHFRRASSVQACPVQTAPYVALLQLQPERFGPNLSGFAPVTSIGTTPLLSSSTILNFASCLRLGGNTTALHGVDSLSSHLLRGGGLRWAESVPQTARDETLSTSEMLVMGHADGVLSFWECCGPASRNDGVCFSDGRMEMREVPSAAMLLGSLPVAELAGGGEGATSAVTAIDVWIERDHVAATERDACWVAVGLDTGEAAVLILSNKMYASRKSERGDDGESGRGGNTPLSDKPVAITDVEMRGGGDVKKKMGWRGFIGQSSQTPKVESEYEDKELEAAIADARAEALEIQAQGWENREDENSPPSGIPAAADVEQDAGGGDENIGIEEQELQEGFRQDVEGDRLASNPSEMFSKNPLVDMAEDREEVEGETTYAAEEEEASNAVQRKVQLDASLVQLVLRLHGHAIRCVALSFDTCTSALALVVADAEGVVSVTDVASGSASLLPMRAPQVRPCHPAITIGPLPNALTGGSTRTGGQQHMRHKPGVAGALYVLLEGWLNVFDLASRDPIDLAEVPGLALESGRDDQRDDDNDPATGRRRVGHVREEDGRTWIVCVDERGVPLIPYASEALSTFDLSPAHERTVHQDVVRSGGARGDGTDGNDGGNGKVTLSPRERRQTTIWVSPAASRTAMERYHEHELQILSGLSASQSFLLIVRGAVSVIIAVAERESVAVSAFARRPPSPHVVAPFKGRSGAELVVKARVEMPAAEGRGPPPRVNRAGVCLVAVGAGGGVVGKIPRRGCLIATDRSGFVTGLLLPSLSPVFRDRLPLGEEVGSRRPGVGWPVQTSVCNLVGELSICGVTVSFCLENATGTSCEAVEQQGFDSRQEVSLA